ncbi:Uncharacterized protein YjaZ [Thalassobacillus cyri]|uniref:Uncharacterized protein YjaZ n=1 Tax=Thalassobacillus cyri TaxID=571932 RepID=A0A1H3WFA5_9BACI|nr:DUF2268 domain-containing putative Zn-dependent protease [Thalassobacillus cyri]SDZ85829.1 Uncharacterized protein YjaZ [Thalassobacillus cyri]
METQLWLDDFVKACEKKSLLFKPPHDEQREALCRPIQKTLSKIPPAELQAILLKHGLFEPFEWKHIHRSVREMEKRDIWKIVEEEYHRLKRKWHGPEAPIYIYPIARAQQPAGRRPIEKSGVSFKECLFLFLAPDTPLLEIKALLAHEYNHMCRFSRSNLDETRLPLKEVLVMEGLAENAVQELYGEKLLAPWTRNYRNNRVREIWKRHFQTALHVQGQEKHQKFLYGKGNGSLPRWIGYQIGFQIITSYQERHGRLTTRELLTKTADELIAGSSFPTD